MAKAAGTNTKGRFLVDVVECCGGLRQGCCCG